MELYTCSTGSTDSEMPAFEGNATAPKAYNELATLMSVTGKLFLARVYDMLIICLAAT